ncbi:hypothetical protein BC629DRAFT_1536354 [Irpex lacteus]|nr:hypothetical protein BC629DRAFT_1536354 [Irpex lacteus]
MLALGCRGIRPSLRANVRAALRQTKRYQSTNAPRPTFPARLENRAQKSRSSRSHPKFQAVSSCLPGSVRCSRIAAAAILGAIDYKWTFAQSYKSPEESERATSELLKALLANGGVFIKLGQHMAALVDRCDPSSLDDIEQMFLWMKGQSLRDMFEEFNPEPIGVATIKLQHPHIQEFCNIDMDMVEFSLGWIKHWFPEFELTWLGGEMRENLPKEIDFTHEARNARRAEEDFKYLRTSLYIQTYFIMEFIRGGRPDDLQYLADHNIDRNAVSLELARIFAQMVHLNGFFHAVRNLLIRPAGPHSRSPYNFDVTGQERRKYAKLVGNIDDELYPVFEAAITGRALLDESPDDLPRAEGGEFKRGRSMIDLEKQTSAEVEAIQKAVMQRRLNDLTRSLDHALATTHSGILLARAVWEDERRRLLASLSTRTLFSFLVGYVQGLWRFESTYRPIILTETWMDFQAQMVILKAWVRGLVLVGGFAGAHQAAAGLA